MKTFSRYSLIVLLILLCLACTNRKKRHARTQAARNEQIITPVIPAPDPKPTPAPQKDTVYIIVPTEPDGRVDPVVDPNNRDLVIITSNKKLKMVEHKDSWPYPPKIIFDKPGIRYSRSEYISNHNIVGEMKELIVACDYDDPTVRNNSVALVGASPGEFNLGQICDIFDFSYTNWSYVNDPITNDYYSKASETIKNGLNGDCDDFAILLCSMILSVGGEARINFAYDTSSGHAFTEVNIGRTNQSEVAKYLSARYHNAQMWHRKDNQGNVWLNMDWQARYPGGEYWKYDSGTCFNIIRNTLQSL
jgi:hypothetical protein